LTEIIDPYIQNSCLNKTHFHAQLLGRRGGCSLEAAGVAPAEHDHLALEDGAEVRRLLALGHTHGVLTQYRRSVQSHHQSAEKYTNTSKETKNKTIL
jgi:hypothetical protein